MVKKITQNVIKRGNSFYVRFSVDGKDKWKSYGANEKAARAIAAQVRSNIEVSKVTNQNDDVAALLKAREIVTFEQAVSEYLSARADLKASSLRNYNNYKKHLLPAFAKRPLHKISPSESQDFLNDLFELGFSPKHCNDVVRFARAVCVVQVKRGVTRSNPFAGARLLREDRGDSREELDPFSRDELDLALTTAGDHWKPIFTLLSFSGMRPAEAFGLRWSDIDWNRSELRITRARVRGEEDSPKTKSSIRNVCLTPHLLESLKRLKAVRQVVDLKDHVFVRTDGKPFDKHIDAVWKRILVKAGIRHRPSYQLRHTYISLCLQNGVEPGWIAQQVGHSTLKMIYEKYARYIPGGSDQNKDRLASIFDGNRRQQSSTHVN